MDELACLFPQIKFLELIGQGGMGSDYKRGRNCSHSCAEDPIARHGSHPIVCLDTVSVLGVLIWAAVAIDLGSGYGTDGRYAKWPG